MMQGFAVLTNLPPADKTAELQQLFIDSMSNRLKLCKQLRDGSLLRAVICCICQYVLCCRVCEAVPEAKTTSRARVCLLGSAFITVGGLTGHVKIWPDCNTWHQATPWFLPVLSEQAWQHHTTLCLFSVLQWQQCALPKSCLSGQ